MSENKVIISPSGKFKAIISEKDDCYTIDVFVLSKNYDHINNYLYGEWARKNTKPIIISKQLHAEHFAIEELRILMGEPDIPLTINWIKDFSFCKDAEFIEPKDAHVFCYFTDDESKESKLIEIKVNRIIDFNGLYLIEEVNEEDDWQMGQANSNGDIVCWGYYGSLKEAIKSL